MADSTTLLGTLTRVQPRDIWNNEAKDFTPWLADHIQDLGKALGIELELDETEAKVGDFSLDVLARDLGTGRKVVIENQLTDTDHDHLGKLLTYAAGFDAGTVIWICEAIREEHRQTLDWLNQRTDSDTQFFGIVIEVLQIDDSKPAYNFKPVVFPNEWLKTRRLGPKKTISARAEAYREYFQALIDELREDHKFTGARVAQPQNWYSFASGFQGIVYGASFALGNRVRIDLYIDQGDTKSNKELFDSLANIQDEIESELATSLDWERLDEKRASRIAVYREGSVDDNTSALSEIREWQVEWILKFKQIFAPRLRSYFS